jgi:sulfur carrier protein
MRIELNGETLEVRETCLSEILRECGYQDARIATALNGEIVHKQSRHETWLNEGDRLEIVAPIFGG